MTGGLRGRGGGRGGGRRGEAAATRPIARGYCTRAVDGPGATQRDSRHIHNSHSRVRGPPTPSFPPARSVQLLPAGARADADAELKLRLGLEPWLERGNVLFARWGVGGWGVGGVSGGHSTVSVTCGKLLTKRMANVCQQEDV